MARRVTGPRLHSTSAANLLLVGSLGFAALIVARVLGPAAYGDYSLAITLCAIAVLTLTLGTGIAVRLLYVEHGQRAFGPYAQVTIGAAVATFVVLAPMTAMFQDSLTFGLAVGFLGAITVLSRQAIDGYHALGRTERAIMLTAAAAALNAALVLVLAALHVLTATWAVLVAALCAFLPLIAFLRTAGPAHFNPLPLRVHWPLAKRMVRIGLPTLGNSLGISILQRADRVVLAAFAGPAALGIYAAAAGLGELARIAPTSIGQVAFYRASTRDLRAERRLRVMGLLLAAVLTAVTIALAPLLVPLLYGQEYIDSVPILQVIALGEVVYALSFVDSRLLLGRGRVKVVGALGLACAIFGMAVYFVLIPPLAGMGAAWASVVNYAALSILMAVAYWRDNRTEDTVGGGSAVLT
mgnify:FL=1